MKYGQPSESEDGTLGPPDPESTVEVPTDPRVAEVLYVLSRDLRSFELAELDPPLSLERFAEGIVVAVGGVEAEAINKVYGQCAYWRRHCLVLTDQIEAMLAVLGSLEKSASEVETGKAIIDARVVAATFRAALKAVGATSG